MKSENATIISYQFCNLNTNPAVPARANARNTLSKHDALNKTRTWSLVKSVMVFPRLVIKFSFTGTAAALLAPAKATLTQTRATTSLNNILEK